MYPKGQARVSFLPAVTNLVFLIFGRISEKFAGFLILFVSATLIIYSSRQIAPVIQQSFAAFEGLSLPIAPRTIDSPIAKSVSMKDLLENAGLVITPQGILPFSQKLKVFSTSYDKNCSGCNETTATGLRTGYGVVAVDPKVIPLGSQLYIPGYGTATAGDTGGSIKGNRVDLGFDDVKNGWWSARFVEIYILK